MLRVRTRECFLWPRQAFLRPTLVYRGSGCPEITVSYTTCILAIKSIETMIAGFQGPGPRPSCYLYVRLIHVCPPQRAAPAAPHPRAGRCAKLGAGTLTYLLQFAASATAPASSVSMWTRTWLDVSATRDTEFDSPAALFAA